MSSAVKVLYGIYSSAFCTVKEVKQKKVQLLHEPNYIDDEICAHWGKREYYFLNVRKRLDLIKPPFT